MSTLSHPVSPVYMYMGFITLCLMTLFNIPNIYVVLVGLVTILISVIDRGHDIYLTFTEGKYQRDNSYWRLFQIFVTHIILFTALYILFKNDYTNPTPVNTVVDAVYYTVDISSTTGSSDIYPATYYSRIIETLNQVDSYLILITFGLYALRKIKSDK